MSPSTHTPLRWQFQPCLCSARTFSRRGETPLKDQDPCDQDLGTTSILRRHIHRMPTKSSCPNKSTSKRKGTSKRELTLQESHNSQVFDEMSKTPTSIKLSTANLIWPTHSTPASAPSAKSRTLMSPSLQGPLHLHLHLQERIFLRTRRHMCHLLGHIPRQHRPHPTIQISTHMILDFTH